MKGRICRIGDSGLGTLWSPVLKGPSVFGLYLAPCLAERDTRVSTGACSVSGWTVSAQLLAELVGDPLTAPGLSLTLLLES